MHPPRNGRDLDGVVVSRRSSGRLFTGAEFLVHALVSAGVTHVFGGHGGAVVPLIDAIEAHPDITWVYCRCEVNASQAAAAYAKLNGVLGCCVGTSGPGASHLLSGLIDAEQDRVPVVCITGLKDSSHIRYADFQDIDQGAIFRMAGLALSESVSDINQLLPITRNAFTLALSSNRCVHLAVPINVQQEKILGRSDFCLGKAFQSRLATPATQLQIDTLALALRTEIESKRHVVIAAGYRANLLKLGPELERLAELLHCPILTSYDGKGTVDENHPLAYGVVGVYGNAGTPSSVDILADCDTVISVCVNELTELVTNKSGLQIRRLVQIDERLIAGDALRFSPSAAFSCGYLQESLQQVIVALEKAFIASSAAHRRRLTAKSLPEFATTDTHEPERSEDIWQELNKSNYVKPTGTPSTFLKGSCHNPDDLRSTSHCHPAVFFGVMRGFLTSDSVVAADIGDNALWMASSLSARGGQRFLTSEHLGIMGYSVNAGLAAALSAKKDGDDNRRTLVVAGDGGIQMSLNELATLKDHGAKSVLVVVVVNRRLGRVQNETWGPRVRADGCHIGSPDYVKLFEAYGYPNGVQLSTCDHAVISDTIEKGWQSAKDHGCCVIELMQDPLVHPIMHKLKAKEDSLAHWEDRIRNPYSHSIYPKIDVQSEARGVVQSWLDGLSEVKLSDPKWLNDGNPFARNSPSDVVDQLLSSLDITAAGGSAVGSFFPTGEAREIFDSQFHASAINAVPSKTLVEEINRLGTSNAHPLRVQLLAMPRDTNWGLHAHPNVELMVPLVGEVWEKRLIGAELSPQVLKRSDEVPTKASPGKFYAEPDTEEIAQAKEHLQKKMAEIKSLGNEGKFIDRSIREGQVLYNAAGSIHRSYTKENGCLCLCIWSGIHADILDCSCCSAIEGSEGLFLP
ncbi:hypothetical protein ACHAXT_006919 [Thalassiosira profunda]